MVLSINSMKPINGFHKVRSFPFTLSVTIYWKEPLYFFDEFSATVSSFCSLCHRTFIWPPFWSYTCWLNCDNPRNLEKSIKTSTLGGTGRVGRSDTHMSKYKQSVRFSLFCHQNHCGYLRWLFVVDLC